MSTVSQLFDQLGDAVGAKVNGLDASLSALSASNGDMNALSTSHKATLVGAVNEIKTGLTSASNAIAANTALVGSKASIDDSVAAADKAFSGEKTLSEITTAIADLELKLTDGASDAFNSFKEFEVLVNSYPDFSQVMSDLGGAVSFAKAQTLTASQQAQAQANMGVPSNTALTAVDNKIGDIDAADPVGAFNAHFAA